MVDKILKSCRRRIKDLLFYSVNIKRINCTFTKKEYLILLKHAENTGLRPTLFLKKAALAYLQKQYLVPVNLEDKLLTIIYIMRNIGNNINQLAAKVNNINKEKSNLKNSTCLYQQARERKNKEKLNAVFDLLKAKENLHRLEDLIENFIKNPNSINDCKIPQQENQKFRAITLVH